MVHPLRQYNLPRKKIFFSYSSGRQISPLSESVVTDHFRQVGSFSTGGGSGISVPESTSIVFSSCEHVSDEEPRQESLASRRGSHSSAERYCRISEPSSYSRLLFPPFSCTKEKWENETCDRPLRPESAFNSATFQDGDQQIYQGFNSFRYVDNVSRFDRRLFPYSYFPQVPQVPEICWGRQGIRFQGNAFWPIYSPSSIYQSFPGSSSTFTQPVNFDPFFFIWKIPY